MRIISRQDALLLGAVRFFTGKPCRHGHLAERFSNCGKCVECHRARARRHYIKSTRLSDEATVERHRKQAARIVARDRLR